MRKLPTELANRSRFALWRRRIDHAVPGILPFSIRNARSLLRAAGGEIDLRSPRGFWARKISECVDSSHSVANGIDPPKHHAGSDTQLQSRTGHWMPKCGPTLIG